MKPQKVLLLLHPDFGPERKTKSVSTEANLVATLKELGHSVEVCLLDDDIRQLDVDIARFKPTIVFNLMEEFDGEGIFDFHPVTLVEAMGIPFTGCNPRGMVISRNKFSALKVAEAVGAEIPVSALGALRGTQKVPKGMRFPIFAKLNREHASLGITAQNRVTTATQLARVCARLRGSFDGRILLQEFIEGRDVSVSVWGNDRAQALTPWLLDLKSGSKFATESLKFSEAYRRKRKIRARRFEGPETGNLKKTAVAVFEALDLNGYARLDFRVTADHRCYLVDVNANPNIAATEDFADAAAEAGIDYPSMIERILRLGLDYDPQR